MPILPFKPKGLALLPFTLADKREQYESWLASGRSQQRGERMITPPAPVTLDDLPAKRELTTTRQQADAGVKQTLITPPPSCAIVRTDDGDGDASGVTDDVRLDLAKALLPKIEGADAATAERIANAASALIGPLMRADDVKAADGQGAAADDKGAADQNLKNRVLGDEGKEDPPNTAAVRSELVHPCRRLAEEPNVGMPTARLCNRPECPHRHLGRILRLIRGRLVDGALCRLQAGIVHGEHAKVAVLVRGAESLQGQQ
jgi:hypothetical protein